MREREFMFYLSSIGVTAPPPTLHSSRLQAPRRGPWTQTTTCRSPSRLQANMLCSTATERVRRSLAAQPIRSCCWAATTVSSSTAHGLAWRGGGYCPIEMRELAVLDVGAAMLRPHPYLTRLVRGRRWACGQACLLDGRRIWDAAKGNMMKVTIWPVNMWGEMLLSYLTRLASVNILGCISTVQDSYDEHSLSLDGHMDMWVEKADSFFLSELTKGSNCRVALPRIFFITSSDHTTFIALFLCG